MTELAAVVLAHRDPIHLRRLIQALEDVPIFLHCDANTAAPVFGQMTDGLPTRVRVCPRIPTNLASWSLVEAELRSLQAALARTAARHVAVLSGADYPLVSVPTMVDELAAWAGRSYLWNVPLPYRPWDTPRNPNGGRWRFQHRFLTRRGQVLFWHGIPLRSPLVRPVPPGLELRASSQWKIYAREHVEILLRVAESRPDLLRFWRSTLAPDESFAASTLASPAIVGSAAIPPCYAHAWYTAWPARYAYHPRWLTTEDFALLRKVQAEAIVDPLSTTSRPADGAEQPGRKLFARKFGTDPTVLDEIDAQLRI